MAFDINFGCSPKKLMYINQRFMDNVKNGHPKVLINPNFVPTVHVNPHFNKQYFPNQTIHVNPNLMRQPETIKPLQTQNISPITLPPATTVTTKGSTNNVVISTRTKLIRRPNSTLSQSTTTNSKYKKINVNKSTKKINERSTYKKSQFKIDYRPSTFKKKQKTYKSLNTLLSCKSIYLKHNGKMNRTRYVKINGVPCKNNSKSLIVKNKISTVNAKRLGKERLLTICGQKYKLDSNHRTLTLISKNGELTKPSFKTIFVGGIKFRQKEPNVFVKTNQKHLLSQAKQKSIQTLTNKMRKCNVTCPFYRKFGKCKGKESGTCIRIHNPDQISLCPKFLQGACMVNNCLLSHRISAEKMPTCKFFLEGLCSKDDCSYLHVKINAKAEICVDFLEGFCKKGVECQKRHQYLCPQFEKNGICKRPKCPYPHGGNRVRKSVVSKKFQEIPMNYKSLPSKDKTDDKNDIEDLININRYYDESDRNNLKIQNITNSEHAKQNNLNLNLLVQNRPKLGNLPSFIPLLHEKEQS